MFYDNDVIYLTNDINWLNEEWQMALQEIAIRFAPDEEEEDEEDIEPAPPEITCTK